ncbi:MAG: serine/threonine-protein kinase [Kofleriaceae bacterium]
MIGDGCLSENTLAALAHDHLDGDEAVRAETHLLVCNSCRDLLHSDDGARPDGPAPRHRWLAGGTRIDHFILTSYVGGGAMGDVFAAVDSRLGRNVAIKVLRQSHAGISKHELKGRLFREAQAMARLSHPNLVTIYDVNELDDQLYLAMEFVQGQTLRSWLSSQPRSHHDILDVLSQAGRGLAAAHAAGVVHRDFKPDNVLVAETGRVCVTDFGLARMDADVPAIADVLAEDGVPPELTRTGAIVGTPAYMAPEQFAGASVDARTDQFAFCVVLFEAVYGKRPFEGTSARELAAQVTTGKPSFPRSQAVVAGRLRRLLNRGLATTPADRFPSMERLLDELRQMRGGWRRRGMIVLAVLVAISIVVASSFAVGGAPSDPIVSPGARYRNYTYAEWLAFSLQRHLQRSYADDPFLGTAPCDKGQSGDVWFLDSHAGEGRFTGATDCTIPANKALFLNIISVFCDSWRAPNLLGGADFPTTKQGLDECVAHTATMTEAHLEIDGASIEDLERFRVRSARFSFAIEDGVTNSAGHPPGVYGGLGQGIAVMLRPLSPGEHVIRWRVAEGAEYMRDVTYRLTVLP